MSHIDRLIEGFGRFRQSYFGDDRKLYDRLKQQGQTTKTIIVGCCDSRVDPAIITDCNPGDLFTIRNVANLVPPYETVGNYHGTSAALEFGVRNLCVENIIVLGHAQCGGIRSLMENDTSENSENSFIFGWMKVAANARNRVLSRMHGAPQDELQRACEQEAILVSLDNLLSFPWILERVAQRKLELHGWYFDLEHGELLHYDPVINAFKPFD
jgi:carbonic anhydrase